MATIQFNQMRNDVLEAYDNNPIWSMKVHNMTQGQIMAIYHSLQTKKAKLMEMEKDPVQKAKIAGYPFSYIVDLWGHYKEQQRESGGHQISIAEYLEEKN